LVPGSNRVAGTRSLEYTVNIDLFKPVTSWANPDIAFIDIAQGIRKAVAELTQNTPHSSIIPPEAESVEDTTERAEKVDLLYQKILFKLRLGLRISVIYKM